MSNPDEQRVVHLQVVAGPDTGRMYFLKVGKEALLGRAPGADLRLNDPGVSSRHCLVRSAGDMVFVEDLKSSNGVKVNGEPCTVRVLDSDGKIELGGTTIELKWAVTQAQVPLASVASPAAPTLMEGSPHETERRNTTTIRRHPSAGSTMLHDSQMKEFTAAKAMLGQTVGNYLLLEPIGIGSAGPVFRGKHLKTRLEAALKVIRRSGARAPELLTQFIKDVKTGLAIPGAANLLDAGEDEKYAYIAMAMYRARELQSLIVDDKRFTPAQAVTLGQELCHTLAVAHSRGIVHRDIRPSNILIEEGGMPILLDLGYPKNTDMEGKFILPVKDDAVARVRYTAPEATRSNAADARTDVFSLGATLYFTITGKHPFTAKTPLETIRKIRWEDVAPLTEFGASNELNSAIMRALAKEPDQRYSNMTDFAAALGA